MRKPATPTDSEILAAVASGHLMMTYVIKNVLRRKFKGLETPWVRRRLIALEKAGKVERLPTNFATQICWGIVAPKD